MQRNFDTPSEDDPLKDTQSFSEFFSKYFDLGIPCIFGNVDVLLSVCLYVLGGVFKMQLQLHLDNGLRHQSLLIASMPNHCNDMF